MYVLLQSLIVSRHTCTCRVNWNNTILAVKHFAVAVAPACMT